MAYEKQTDWENESYVNPTRMNHIEQGIYDLDQGLDPKGKMWAVLFNQSVSSTSASTVGTTSNRSLTKYPTLCFTFVKAGIARASVIVPSDLFADGTNVDVSYVGGDNTRHAISIAYVSDTSVSVSASSNNNDYKLNIYALTNTPSF